MLVGLADRIGEVLYQERNSMFLEKHYNPAYPVLSLLEDQGAVEILARPLAATRRPQEKELGSLGDS